MDEGLRASLGLAVCEKERLKSQWVGDHNGLSIVRERKRGLLLERIREEAEEKPRSQKYDVG